MVEIFLKTLPFFAIIGLGYFAGWRGFFSAGATVYLTKFVFYFALSAMLFHFSANLNLGEVFSWDFTLAYLVATSLVYGVGFGFALLRKLPIAEAAVEAQCCAIGNVGFIGIPMLAILMGDEAVGYVMIALAVDLIVFGSLIVLVIVAVREGRMGISVISTLLLGLARNPMIVAIAAGLTCSVMEIRLPAPIWEFVKLLGAAATPCALFAIGASLAEKSTERLKTAFWLSFGKLILHPAAVAVSALVLFDVPDYPAAVMIVASSLPVAGNIYILAQHYRVAPQRVSASIFVSTAISIVSISFVLSLISVQLSF
ncbi:MAG: malate transporter [Rhodobacteraceae bacterium]|nr:malate transporter [Paracoccaceae bacterium]